MKKLFLFFLIFSLSLISVYATPSVGESIAFLIWLVIVWLFVSLCIYIAHGMISSKNVRYKDSLGASLVGYIAIVACIVFFGPFVGLLIAIFAWLAVIMAMLDLNFGQSIAVTIVAIVVSILLIILIAAVISVTIISIF